MAAMGQRNDKRHDRSDDPRTTDDLFDVALHNPDDDTTWTAIAALHLRGTHAVFERACELCESQTARERRVGADVLGQVGRPDDTWHEGAVDTLLALLEHEREPEVLDAICIALGHRGDVRAIRPVARFKDHPDANVRHSVAFGLLAHEDDLAIETLIELSRDPDAMVRDWAAFGLGAQIDTDTPQIRQALYNRLTDDDEDTRHEAMVGLSKRKDERVFEPLRAALLEDARRGHTMAYYVEAAAELADPRLYPLLAQLRDNWQGERTWVYDDLEEAIEQCRPPSN